MPDSPIPLIKGTVDVMILKALSFGPGHGYAISRWIARTSGDVFSLQEGALYPALRRLEEKALVESEWVVTETGREARTYRLTAAGRQRLRSEVAEWTRYVDAMGRLLRATRGVA
jgi:PadR family transcriptional regulator, regulatory protein PadR